MSKCQGWLGESAFSPARLVGLSSPKQLRSEQFQAAGSTYQPAMEDPPKPEVPEKVPLKYRDPESKDLLKAGVKGGGNKIDFAQEADPVEAPQSKDRGKGKGKPKGPVLCY